MVANRSSNVTLGLKENARQFGLLVIVNTHCLTKIGFSDNLLIITASRYLSQSNSKLT